MTARAFVTRTAIATIAMLVGCSSSSGGGTAGVLACQGSAGASGPGSTACNSCIETSCSSQLSAAESPCSAYLSCYASCQCMDGTCIDGCTAKATGSCANPFADVGACIGQSCATPCLGPSSSDGGSAE